MPEANDLTPTEVDVEMRKEATKERAKKVGDSLVGILGRRIYSYEQDKKAKQREDLAEMVPQVAEVGVENVARALVSRLEEWRGELGAVQARIRSDVFAGVNEICNLDDRTKRNRAGDALANSVYNLRDTETRLFDDIYDGEPGAIVKAMGFVEAVGVGAAGPGGRKS